MKLLSCPWPSGAVEASLPAKCALSTVTVVTSKLALPCLSRQPGLALLMAGRKQPWLSTMGPHPCLQRI